MPDIAVKKIVACPLKRHDIDLESCYLCEHFNDFKRDIVLCDFMDIKEVLELMEEAIKEGYIEKVKK